MWKYSSCSCWPVLEKSFRFYERTKGRIVDEIRNVDEEFVWSPIIAESYNFFKKKKLWNLIETCMCNVGSVQHHFYRSPRHWNLATSQVVQPLIFGAERWKKVLLSCSCEDERLLVKLPDSFLNPVPTPFVKVHVTSRFFKSDAVTLILFEGGGV